MITRPIRLVTHHPDSGGVGGGWSVMFDHETNGPYCYLIPVSMLWYRSAEYGIPLTDGATLSDVALNELAGRALGETVEPINSDFPYHVDSATAWAGHRARVARIKSQITHPDPGNLLGQIATHHTSTLTDPDLQKLHQDHVKLLTKVRGRGMI